MHQVVGTMSPGTRAAADRLAAAYGTQPCAPIAELIESVDDAYAVQEINTTRWLADGRRLVGRKVGLTSAAVQRQMGVAQPDYGMLFADMAFDEGAEIDCARLLQPKAEAEIAFVVGRDLPELVEKMNALQGDDAVSLDAMRQTVEAYDAQIDRGQSLHNDEQLRRIAYVRHWKGDRIRTCKFQKILDPKAGPLIAVREFIISRKSLGGIQTDLQSRVLDHAGAAIPGLFAAGEAAGFGGGGMHGLRALEGSFLGGCILSGRIAGQAAASTT